MISGNPGTLCIDFRVFCLDLLYVHALTGETALSGQFLYITLINVIETRFVMVYDESINC